MSTAEHTSRARRDDAWAVRQEIARKLEAEYPTWRVWITDTWWGPPGKPRRCRPAPTARSFT